MCNKLDYVGKVTILSLLWDSHANWGLRWAKLKEIRDGGIKPRKRIHWCYMKKAGRVVRDEGAVLEESPKPLKK